MRERIFWALVVATVCTLGVMGLFAAILAWPILLLVVFGLVVIAAVFGTVFVIAADW